MKNYVRMFFTFLCCVLVIVSIVSFKMITDIRNYGKLINYVGIVRGASQRAVKLETNSRQADSVIRYVNEILEELQTGEGQYGLVTADSEQYQSCLIQLDAQWESVKQEIRLTRGGKDRDELLDASEHLFEIANQTVFSIEAYSAEVSRRVGHMIFTTAVAGITVLVCVTGYSIKKYFELEGSNKRLEKLAYCDDLTGAYVMEKFYSEVDRLLLQKEYKYAVLYIDFENFKYVNDVFGYAYGDELLKNYAHCMMASMKEDELLGRSMADRFTALRRYEDKEELLRLQKAVDEEFLNSPVFSSNNHMMTIACGICCVEDLIETPEARMMVTRANFAQKTVKNKPHEHYAFYDDGIRQKLIVEMSMRNHMEEGLARGEFVVYMQPKVGVSDGKVRGAEALVRWDIPGHGLLSPGVFIPVLEKNHFIGRVDRYVFECVCSWMSGRLTKGLVVVPVSVNVSKIQFYNPDFIEVYTNIKKQYGIPDGMLELELTESVAFERQDYLIQVVRRLHQNGFQCSLDDFGSGYSSLGMLKDLPIDVLKLDGMFFRVSVDVNREHTIVRSIINMVKALDISTVAEGVEKEEQVEFLRSVGCDLIQGFIFYKPMALREFDCLLDRT